MSKTGYLAAAACVCFGPTVQAAAARAKDTMLTHLDRLVDAKSLSKDDTNLWRTVPYRAEDFSGVMLADGGGPKPKPLAIRLGVKGPHRIYLGIHSGYGLPQIRVRLSKDPSSQVVKRPDDMKDSTYDCGVTIYEVPWKPADLTGQDIVLEGVGDPKHRSSGLAFIRLEPLAKRRIRYPMAITNDGHGIFGQARHTRPEDLVKAFDNIPDDTCMRMLIWGIGEGDVCNYPTKVGTYEHCGGEYVHAFSQTRSKNLSLWKAKGWDSLQVVRDYARKRKWEFQVYIRMEAFASPFPFDRGGSKFFHSHPQYHCLDREGQRVCRLSYAYPEVQDHMVRLISEIAGYQPDGVCMCFIRGIPLVLYEPIMIEGFTKKHGKDPRQLREQDPLWMAYQGEVISGFVAKAKRALKPNQRLSAIVPGNELDCRRWGLDVQTWVKEGLIDDLIPVGQRFDERDVHRDDPDKLDFKYFCGLAGRGRIRLMPMLYPWDKFRRDYAGWRKLMHSFLDAGANGYVVWDAFDYGPWGVANRFVRVSDIGYDRRDAAGPAKAKRIRLLSVQGFRVDRYHQFEVL